MRAVLRPLDADDGRLVEKAAKLVIAVVSVALATILLCGCVPVEDAPAAMLPPDNVNATEHANGMPLDAISYDPPAWMPTCESVYMICDRTTGERWWLLRMTSGQYVELPPKGSDA